MGLDMAQPASVRISAVRAVYEYCEHLRATGSTQSLTPYLPKILDAVLVLATQFSTEVLSLVLETLHVLLKVSLRSLIA